MSPETGELLVKEVVPRIRSLAPSLTPVGCEDQAELAQDAIVFAAALLMSAKARGKAVTPGNAAFYSIALIRQGRRSTGERKNDPLNPAARLSGRCQVTSLEAPIGCDGENDEVVCLHDVLAAHQEDPSMAASRRLDWKQLLARLDNNACEVLNCLAIGEDLTKLVPRLRRSRSALQTDKERLVGVVREHFGPEILATLQERPRWRDNIEANREGRPADASGRWRRKSKRSLP